jgi:4-amino-4-deoxy-L-arabinose transferase-like glycosyltransferase
MRRSVWLVRHGTLWAIVLVAALLRLWRLGEAALIGDESYYWLWSERLAPAYYDNAAGVALLVRLSTLLGGQSELGVRWLNALLGIGAVCMTWAVGLRLYSRRAGAISALLIALGAPYLVVSRFVYTDGLQIALLLLNVYLLIPFVSVEASAVPTWRFWAAGFSMAALLNTKYNAYLYALAVSAFIAWRRPSALRDRRTWLAMGVAACGLLPVLLWNGAHGWSSFRWQLDHFFVKPMYRSTTWNNVKHAALYLTPPLLLLALVGASQVRQARRQVLLVPALALVLPVLLSRADSPRNLLAGVTLLLLLAGDAFDRWMESSKRLAVTVLGGVVLVVGLYGLGTVLETGQPTLLPSSSVARALRIDSAGWRNADALGLRPGAAVFALDYSIASQLRYYTGIPVQTAWGQYRVWGVPAICGPDAAGDIVQIAALNYIDADLVSERLDQTFAHVRGPVEKLLGEGKTLRIWTVQGCLVDQETFLDRFDFLDLVEAGDER